MCKNIFFLLCLMASFAVASNVSAQQNSPNNSVQPSVSAPTLPSAYSTNMTINYIRSRQAIAPITDATTFNNADNTQVKEATQYVDGLGRPMQTVIKQASPLGKDMVAPILYNEFGQEAVKYLPYVDESETNGTSGNFKTNAFEAQQTFSTNQYPGESVFYSKTVFEASPSGRVLKTFSPGNSWAGSEGTTAEHAMSIQYLISDASDSVRIWQITNNDIGCPTNSTQNLPTTASIYQAGALLKYITTNEVGKQVIEYKDKEGQLVLRKVQIAESPIDAYNGWLCTYYVYDDFGLLRFTIPPKAVNLLLANSWSFTATPLIGMADELCYRYEYDARHRVIAKKVAGSGWQYMVYDPRDRLAYMQDANMNTNGQWLCTLYDALNRPTATGMVNYSGCRQTLQDALNAAFATATPTTVTTNFALPPNLYINNRVTSIPVYRASNSIEFVDGFESGNSDEFETDFASGNTTTTVASLPYNPIPFGTFTGLTHTYYDNYAYLSASSKAYNTTDNAKLDDGGNAYPETMPNTQSLLTMGMVTGSWVRTIEDPTDLTKGQWLETATYYDDKGRPIQTQSDNYKGGKDVGSCRYNFTGQPITTYQTHQNPAAGIQMTIKTAMLYDQGGRLLTLKKTLNDIDTRTLQDNTYNELGQLVTKKLGQKTAANIDPMETLDYDYTIRGWLKGINKDYSRGTATDNWFGMELNYDWGFTNNQYNGNIAGTQWKTAGSGEQRAYGYGYDNANRLLYADFNQNFGSGWLKQDPNSSLLIDFSVKMGDGVNYSSAYDDNGNILQMQQWGLKLNTSPQIDNLRYSYNTNSNKLQNVINLLNDPATTLGNFKTNATHPQATQKDAIKSNTAFATYTSDVFGGTVTPVVDYGYDVNGNKITDRNKGIDGSTGIDQISGGAITYNYLNQPYKLTVAGKGSITYIYDAVGNKLEKRTIDNTAATPNTSTTYMGGCVYQNNVLQFVAHEEGRARPLTIGGFAFDYFIKDHLGNTRMVLTEEQKQDIYPAATLEDGAVTTESNYYSINTTNIQANPVYLTGSYQNNNGITNPNPTINPNSNSQKMYRLNAATGSKTGLGITLKVMAGDNINLFAKSFWHVNTGQVIDNNHTLNAGIVDFLTAFVGTPAVAVGAAHGGVTGTSLSTSTSTTGGLTGIFNGMPINADKPKAYLNWILFDEQFKPVTNGSGFDPVDVADQIKSHSQNVSITKNGFLYIYCSNESNIDVFFDNLQVTNTHGPLLEETHYYPFGLTMAGISSKAVNGAENRYKFNGGTELNTDLDLNIYETPLRGYDPQIGRFGQIDMLAEMYASVSPYHFSGNNPIMINDPTGAHYSYIDDNGNAWHHQDPLLGTAAESKQQYQEGNGFDGFGGATFSNPGIAANAVQDYLQSKHPDWSNLNVTKTDANFRKGEGFEYGFTFKANTDKDVSVGAGFMSMSRAEELFGGGRIASILDGDFSTQDLINVGISVVGANLAMMEGILRNESNNLLKKGISNGMNSYYRRGLNNLGTAIENAGKYSKRLGIAGAAMTIGSLGIKYYTDGITKKDLFDAATTGLLLLTVTNPLGLPALGIYGLLDAMGTFDGVKDYIGADDTVLFKSN